MKLFPFKLGDKILIIIVLLSIFFTSCLKKYPAHLKIIPKGIGIAVALDPTNIYQKGKFFDMKNFNFLENKLTNENNKKIVSFLEQPQKFGVDFFEKIYLFNYKDNNNKNFTGLTAGLENSTLFEKSVKELYAMLDFHMEIQDSSSIKYFIEKELIIGWDEDKIVGLVFEKENEQSVEILYDIFKRKLTKGSIIDEQNFVNFLEKESDISVWTEHKFLINKLGELSQISQNLYADESYYKNSYNHIYITFNDNDVTIKNHSFPNEKYKEAINKLDIINPKPIDSLFAIFPENTLALLGLSLNINNIYKYIKEEGSYDLPLQHTNEIFTSLGTSLDQIVGSLNGNILFNLYDVVLEEKEVAEYNFDDRDGQYKLITKTKTNIIPKFGLAFKMNNTLLYDKILQNFSYMFSKKDNYYQFGADLEGMNFFMYCKDNILLINNNEEAMKNFMKGTKENNSLLDNKKVTTIFDKDFAALFFNFTKTEVLTHTSYASSKWIEYIKIYENIHIGATNSIEAEINIELKENPDNSLYVILSNLPL